MTATTITTYTTVRRPDPAAITIRAYPCSAAGPHPGRATYWRLELADDGINSIDIIAGHFREDLENDLAYMRRLEAAASELAGLLQAALEQAGQEVLPGA